MTLTDPQYRKLLDAIGTLQSVNTSDDPTASMRAEDAIDAIEAVLARESPVREEAEAAAPF